MCIKIYNTGHNGTVVEPQMLRSCSGPCSSHNYGSHFTCKIIFQLPFYRNIKKFPKYFHGFWFWYFHWPPHDHPIKKFWRCHCYSNTKAHINEKHHIVSNSEHNNRSHSGRNFFYCEIK